MKREEDIFAHWTQDGRRHGLYGHLCATARLAGEMAQIFGCKEWGYIAGLWHDLGKYSRDFQQKVHQSASARVDHSTVGALHATQAFQEYGRILAYAIAGHHAGLPDWKTGSSAGEGLEYRLKKQGAKEQAEEAVGRAPREIRDRPFPTEKPKPGSDPSLWIRMLYSCLVDADYLDTEAFFDPYKADRRGGYPALAELRDRFDSFMETTQRNATDTPVNRIRADILRQCLDKSGDPSGIFTLTAPTGTGKTLSSTAFALHHAIQMHKRRIIYVIPYTSIVEQTADCLMNIFGDALVEHHSNFDGTADSQTNEETGRTRLACENWDAPVIITTAVQFFESLYASRPGRCRKIHNIAESVVILDEAQTLPPDFLSPIIKVLKELNKSYSTTIVLSTATTLSPPCA